MMSDLNLFLKKISDFVSFPLFGFTLLIKLRNFDFECHWSTLIFLNKKNDVKFDYVLSNSVWFKPNQSSSSRILAISWEIGNLNFTKVV